MSSRRLLLYALLLALLSSPVIAADGNIQGRVTLSPALDGPIWVGQELTLHLELWSTGFSFGDQRFALPEVPGAFLLQADSGTVSLSRKEAGIQWQGLRYDFLLYPQRDGRVVVPSFEVGFSASAGFGSTPASFRLMTESLTIETRLPPGAGKDGLVVSTTSFAMNATWSPTVPADGPMEMKPGDAVTLTVERTADGIPGMVFSPLPEMGSDGLRAYPEAPQINDKINRGELRGFRTDSITFICQREGEFELPPLRFQWWDPDREVLEEQLIPAVQLRVLPVAGIAGGAAADEAIGNRPVKKVVAAFVILLLLAAAVAVGWKHITAWWQQVILEVRSGERWAFRRVGQTCKSGSALDAYNAINLWLGRIERFDSPVTLFQLASDFGNSELLEEVACLQIALVSDSPGEWQGRTLYDLLRKLRKSPVNRASRHEALSPLNPL